MMDRLTKEHRSWNMSRIKGKNTKPEMIVRKMMHERGYRFRLHCKDLPGCPDIVLPKYRTVIFVHGCYWHRHKGCRLAYIPKSRVAFWTDKFSGNVERDRKHKAKLKKLGWNVGVIWECETQDRDILYGCIKEIMNGGKVVKK
jgi:DNA mismatch endonuclease (patch repair protein)